MRRHLEYWMRGDFEAMWETVCAETQREMGKDKFLKNVRESEEKYIVLTEIVFVKEEPERRTSDTAYVRYQVRATITESEAAHLRKNGQAAAKAGPWTFRPVVRQMRLEDGQWRICVKPSAK